MPSLTAPPPLGPYTHLPPLLARYTPGPIPHPRHFFSSSSSLPPPTTPSSRCSHCSTSRQRRARAFIALSWRRPHPRRPRSSVCPLPEPVADVALSTCPRLQGTGCRRYPRHPSPLPSPPLPSPPSHPPPFPHTPCVCSPARASRCKGKWRSSLLLLWPLLECAAAATVAEAGRLQLQGQSPPPPARRP